MFYILYHSDNNCCIGVGLLQDAHFKMCWFLKKSRGEVINNKPLSMLGNRISLVHFMTQKLKRPEKKGQREEKEIRDGHREDRVEFVAENRVTGRKVAAGEKKRNYGRVSSFTLSSLVCYQPSGHPITQDPIFFKTVSLSSLCLRHSVFSWNLAASFRPPLDFISGLEDHAPDHLWSSSVPSLPSEPQMISHGLAIIAIWNTSAIMDAEASTRSDVSCAQTGVRRVSVKQLVWRAGVSKHPAEAAHHENRHLLAEIS